MKKLLAVCAALLASALIAAGIASAQPATPPASTVGTAPTLDVASADHAQALAREFGPGKSVMAVHDNITVADLDRMGIAHGDWANGAPPMRLVAIAGTYTVSTLGEKEPLRTSADMVIMVIDKRNGIPTITVAGPSAQLNAMLAAY